MWAKENVDRVLSAMKSLNLRDKRVLDIGCRDGVFSFAAEQMGAGEIIGIDNDLSRGLTEFLIPFKRSRVQARQLNVNDLEPDTFGQFDVVLFAGVLYHLRYPIWALRRVADVLKDDATLLIEGGFIDGFADLPIMFCPARQHSPYDTSSCTFFNEAGLTETLTSLGFSEIRCIASFSYSTRHYVGRMFWREFPRFFWRNWWRLPRVSRKIFICRKRWTSDPRFAATSHMAEYWNADHRWHTGN